MTPPRGAILSPRLQELLAARPSTLVLSGAGMSQESGVPTFRGSEGLWREYRAEELATPDAFERNPSLVWEWYRWRREVVSRAEPNAGHYALAQMETALPQLLIATQNVDGLHARAGSRRVLELHGNLFRTLCCACGDDLPETEAAQPPRDEVPFCRCGGRGRPGVVWFGETLPAAALREAMAAALHSELVLVVGTSSVVYPAAGIAEAALAAGAHVVVVNPEPTPLAAEGAEWIDGSAATVLPELAALLQ